jgi:C-terminal processing protease CtpA/Prc
MQDPWNTEFLKSQPLEPPLTKGIIGIGVGCGHAPQKLKDFKLAGKEDQLRKEKSNDCIIAKIMDNTPASKDGRLRAGDKILEVNGTKIKKLSLIEIVNLIGGEPGIYMTILVEGNPSPITIQRTSASILKE